MTVIVVDMIALVVVSKFVLAGFEFCELRNENTITDGGIKLRGSGAGLSFGENREPNSF